MPCLLDPPCINCAFGRNQPLPQGDQKIIMLKSEYGCTKGGGDIVQTVAGVGLRTTSGIRYLTPRGEMLVSEKGLTSRFNL